MSEIFAVQQVMAHYVRATDRRDGEALAALFVADGAVEILHREQGQEVFLGELRGREAIAQAVASMMKPHGPRDWSHHTTFDPIIIVSDDEATLDSQFIVYAVEGNPTPDGGWGAAQTGAQGTIRPIESGYYRGTLRKDAGSWRFVRLRIHLDLPFVVPAAQ